MKSIQQESMVGISKFIDEITANINALNSLSLPVNTFEIIFVQYLTQKLDNQTCRLWKESLSDERFPNFNNFIKFLNGRRQLMQNVGASTSSVNRIQVSDKIPYRKTIKPVELTRSTFHTNINLSLIHISRGTKWRE